MSSSSSNEMLPKEEQIPSLTANERMLRPTSARQNLQTNSPTDTSSVSPITKILTGVPGQKRTRPQVLKAVAAKNREKRMKEMPKESSHASADKTKSLLNDLIEKRTTKVRKMVLVPVSPNIPRNPPSSAKKTPKVHQDRTETTSAKKVDSK
jgi:hypothetical protein